MLVLTKEEWEKFHSRVDPVDENGCMKWNGATNDGYGRFHFRGKYVPAFRLAYEAQIGPIPQGLELDHVWDWGCRSKLCVNAYHLEPVTKAENSRRWRERVYGPDKGPVLKYDWDLKRYVAT